MKIRRILVVIVGVMQSFVAASVFIFAFILYFDFFGVQTCLDMAIESYCSHVFILLGFGFFSIISGLFLIHEWLESR